MPAGKPIVIVEYDPRWPETYGRERALVAEALGDRLLAIEHIGSTAVPGLGAKPIVDLMAGLASLAQAEACFGPLEAIGYSFVPAALADLPDDRYFEKWVDGVELAHLHLTAYGGAFWRDHLTFRDHLRRHPDEAAAYERLKRELAPRFSRGGPFAQAKSDFIRAALERARRAGRPHPE